MRGCKRELYCRFDLSLLCNASRPDCDAFLLASSSSLAHLFLAHL